MDTNWEWCPIENEYIVLDTNTIKHKIVKIPIKKFHWKSFDEKTRIGWRGPIMLWKDVKNKIYYD
uniref:Uncharacterized protein n=1 Tax=Marseillevirus LCMAC102 TaxID=2506603 RepID=A0A481YVI8_9VIRU|nr:MAG: hypothetical protein LCMAC102_03590 [Marseillevirus LCMAC102]